MSECCIIISLVFCTTKMEDGNNSFWDLDLDPVSKDWNLRFQMLQDQLFGGFGV